jgi:hypothetical protein
MGQHDDSDVKIFTSSASVDNEADDFILIAEQLEAQRANGNIDKAKLLGEKLALLTPENEPVKSLIGKTDIAPNILYQIRVLMVFAMHTTIHNSLHLPMLYSTAVNSMYDKLIKNSPGFYDNISDGVAFTFYSLALRKGFDTQQHIGERFAMLCSKEGNQKVVELGASIYKLITEKVVEEISGLKFAE